MIIGIPREIKTHEYRVALTPAAVARLVEDGHRVVVESAAGAGAGFADADYLQAGAEIVAAGNEVYQRADLIVKVKEPLEEECRQLRPGQILFAYLHLAANPLQLKLLRQSGATCIAFETQVDAQGGLPLLQPMSEIAGHLAVQAGAVQLQRENGGRGVLLGGVSGVAPAKVVVIGGGNVGVSAARIAVGIGAKVTVLDSAPRKIADLDVLFGDQARCLLSSEQVIAEQVANADLVIGAVLVKGDKAPQVLTRRHLQGMPEGAVFVDVAIDQGGCCETSRPTTYEEPTYVEEGVIHYCVGNMPAAVPRTASQALSAAVLPYVRDLAAVTDIDSLTAAESPFASGVNIHRGEVTDPAVKALVARDSRFQ
ncbi:MAG: alanine dehydrogenase [Porticoccaceae bacterium]